VFLCVLWLVVWLANQRIAVLKTGSIGIRVCAQSEDRDLDSVFRENFIGNLENSLSKTDVCLGSAFRRSREFNSPIQPEMSTDPLH